MRTLRPATVLHVFHLSLLRSASLLVPARQRGEWWREWRSELWHVRQACTPSHGILWTAEQEVTLFCLGAFKDAMCLRGKLGVWRQPFFPLNDNQNSRYLLLRLILLSMAEMSLLLAGPERSPVGAERRACQ